MLLRLVLLMTVVPAVELYLLIEIGRRIGSWQTVAIIVGTGALGAALAKREGLGVLRRIREDLAAGVPPADRLVEGLLVLLGGALLVTPGVLTDATGFLLIAPWTRRPIARALRAWAARKLEEDGWVVRIGPEAPPPPAPPDDGGGFDHPVH